MAATNADREPGRRPLAAVWRRVADARWVAIAGLFIAVVLYASGAIAPLWAAAVFVAVALAGLLPRGSETIVPVTSPQPAPAPVAEGGIARFAEALPDPSFVLDRRGFVLYANGRALAAFAVRSGEQLTARLRAPDLLAAFDRVARGGPPERIEFAERVPTERWFAAWFSRLEDATHSGELIALILEDLSERRRVEKIRVDFVANASHELRTPLASLAGFIETLQGPAREDPAARERFLKIMHDQATRMSRLVDDLLSLSRVEMKAHLRPSGEADLVAVVRHLAEALEPLARELGVAIETTLPDAPALVTGDRDELIQLFENLIENACKYGQSGKRVAVTVAAATSDAGPAVTVRDFGPGIPEEHIPRLTERFYRVDIDASRQHRGTGLGLAIAKHILARHHARLTIESRPGEGAVFVVVFPQATSFGDPPMRDNTY